MEIFYYPRKTSNQLFVLLLCNKVPMNIYHFGVLYNVHELDTIPLYYCEKVCLIDNKKTRKEKKLIDYPIGIMDEKRDSRPIRTAAS